ncbi:unnamed protein product [Mycena citricolor]|uniref:Uncharacterized protein n=1 Tax=Mycena citricolor TaxID=2018698 RepID=A0AAD2H5R6_9AGAR|nr:unnamed protein product [Mycena citricolor]
MPWPGSSRPAGTLQTATLVNAWKKLYPVCPDVVSVPGGKCVLDVVVKIGPDRD